MRHPPVKPNQVATHLLNVAKAPQDKSFKSKIQKEWRKYRRTNKVDDHVEFRSEDVAEALACVKLGTASGYDNIQPELLKHTGPRAQSWLARFFTHILATKKLPKIWKRAKVIALPKPGKDHNLPSSYRPISLLSVSYKLLERLILNKIMPSVENVLSVDQAGFRPGRSCCDQVLALTTYIENGFQSNLKTGVVFLDLTAAYDTVWHKGLLVKLSRQQPRWVVDAVETLLPGRSFRAHMSELVETTEQQTPARLRSGSFSFQPVHK
jgi:hypothetical protein